ncbi:MAG: hypothetical protein KY476_08385 [Planctomycetes bacterium]|nr:hypothetical protein [Planctomycetota bacterium]
MKTFPEGRRLAGGLWGCLAALFLAGTALAAPDAQQRRELADIGRDARAVAGLIRRDQFDEAQKALDEAEQRLEKVKQAAKLEDTDRAYQLAKKAIDDQRANLLQAQGVSFTKHVQPIFKKHCTGCHGGENPRNGLSLESFAGLARGGQNGVPIVPGNARRSPLALRLVAPGQAKMPPGNRPSPTPQEIQLLALWINQGAKDDTAEEAKNPSQPKASNVPIAMATGSEKVSFTRDIAPFMVNLCLGCHSGNNPRGGLSLETFAKMMEGGDSGRVIIPGNREGSRLFRLVGGLENPRMPQGQARITRTNYDNLITWFDEGNKFDGKDANTPLRQLVPTQTEMLAERLAKLSPEAFVQLRVERTEAALKRALPKETFRTVEGAEAFVYGNVSEARLEQVSGWAEEHVKELRKLFGEKGDRLWNGKLAVIVIKDRFGYEEFNIVVNGRQNVPPEMTGHSEVTASMEDAYVVLQDVGDNATETSPGLRVNLIDHMTGAFLERGAGTLPDWLVRGTGLALAARSGTGGDYVRGLKNRVPEYLKSLARPEDLFANGQFSPAAVGAVGYTLVEFMLNAGGPAKFGQFIRALESGQPIAAAANTVYGASLSNLATAYFATVQSK